MFELKIRTAEQIAQDKAAEVAEQRRQEIERELSSIDIASIRALRSNSTGRAGPKDQERLAELENQAQALRNELRQL